MTYLLKRIALVAAVVCAASCTMKKQEAPELSGPSEFGTSVSMTVTPDILTQDGASQSLVSIMARDSNGQALRNLSLRAEIQVGGLRADYGSLSARNLVTGNDGHASLVYTAPPAPAVGVDGGMVVTIAVTPVGTDFANSSTRSVFIRLVPPGVVVPPDGLKPAFTVTPPAPSDSQTVLFDASSSSAAAGNAIVSYAWNFGDGGRGSGVTATHSYDTAGTYVVTLTITDGVGRSAQKSQSVVVSPGLNPTAAFTSSPTDPLINQAVNFNASGSRAAPGHTIDRYDWDFGDGTFGHGQTTSHSFGLPRAYVVVLTITDDSGKTATSSGTVTVK
jgi:chitodextrinase